MLTVLSTEAALASHAACVKSWQPAAVQPSPLLRWADDDGGGVGGSGGIGGSGGDGGDGGDGGGVDGERRHKQTHSRSSVQGLPELAELYQYLPVVTLK